MILLSFYTSISSNDHYVRSSLLLTKIQANKPNPNSENIHCSTAYSLSTLDINEGNFNGSKVPQQAKRSLHLLFPSESPPDEEV